MNNVKYYPPLEEKLNVFSHAIGSILSIVALIFLVIHASLHGDVWHVVSFSIFGISLIALFSISTCYHSSQTPEIRQRLRIVDHAAIYILIAGTYTPFSLVTLSGIIGWVVFGVAWGMAALGIVLKLFFTARYTRLSTSMYVLMGWMIIFFIKPLIAKLSEDGLFWLVVGGLAYTIGAVLYTIKRLRFNHALFHVFVLLGSACHFICIYYFVLP